ncbi:transmembrane protein 203 [Strongylocentrotus purpuratus]|uniref:Transmembrane protein 203 n=1 Tax=Strongylocentrotus purpuratus TaxID=7668 RepID=A0A7M7GKV2_STRPU|nr:transmembrane protein 203 [Strongylocentrotus purpuratus]|eukprot:XP_003726467.1 PREDICTED: transmembrane protein 203-like [Strongylocentrotus purpuratus]
MRNSGNVQVLADSAAMLFTIKEARRWLGMTVFEMWINAVSLLVFSVVLALKGEGIINASWWVVFLPLFIATGLNAYFSIIVFVRLYVEDLYRSGIMRILWSGLVLALIFVFELLLCKRLENETTVSSSLVMSPLFVMIHVLLIRACQVS